ncbi:MAG: cystathionine beta-lyase [Alphaproteobacteria bacterium]
MKKDTEVVGLGRKPEENFGIVNPPVYHASTVLFPTVAALKKAIGSPFDVVYYGRMGTPTSFAFEEAMTKLEGGHRAVSVSSGLAAITVSLLSFLRAGDHLLMVDTAYNPTRKFCDGVLAGLGVETTYYDPLIGKKIASLIRPNTKVVYLESPGSLTFEIQDVAAVTKAAKKAGVLTMLDNTWATPLFFHAFDHGVDVVIHAATKYIAGHSDAMLGAIVTADKERFHAVKTMAVALGDSAGADELYLGLRGLRTLAVRLQRHQETGIRLAHWLKSRPEVARVLHPALPDDQNHVLWRRDFKGANGLFGMILHPVSEKAVAAMLDGMTLFKMGFSWGGYESLILPVEPWISRTATLWARSGPYLRLHAGLEDVEDLIGDLEQGFERLNSAA